jgi:uncharacterized protein (DUF849 family)
MIQAALNGGRTRREHSSLPVTPGQLAAEAAAAVEAGAGAIHLHVRNAKGKESIAAADVARTVEAVRQAVPGVPISISTGAWIVPDPAERVRIVRSWTTLPDLASVNFHESGAADLAMLLITRGVGVEAGVLSAAAAQNLVRSGIASRTRRLLLEPLELEPDEAQRNLEAMLEVLEMARIELPRLLHGYGANAWPMLEQALRRGWDTRIGFEDTLKLPDGSPAPNNAALVAAAARLAKRLARRKAQP